ncbi:hypothetical protein NSZ01_35410 [Nocardioides szechwanensis]|nr:hypothetical protein NSZ01_35410 [Nocardioides szechwanensis]
MVENQGGATRGPLLRVLQVAGLAAVAILVSAALDNLDVGLVFAAAIIVGELLWITGRTLVRTRRRQHEDAP